MPDFAERLRSSLESREGALFGVCVPVPLSNELIRISKVARRAWSAEELEVLADEMTGVLRAPGGRMRLRPLQAAALLEIGMFGGLFGPLPVGSGKTLISLLAPVVCFSERPLLIIPAKLQGKTERDRRELGEHWDLPRHLRVMTYEWLGRAQAAEALHHYLPDLIVSDEAHKISNLKAAVTRRVRRYVSEHTGTKFVGMSGTVTKRSLHDFAHLAKWALGPESCFVPVKYQDLEHWADALDERKGQVKRADPGALRILCDDDELERWKSDARAAARSAFRRRMVDTPGAVAATETAVDATLTVSSVEPEVSRVVDEAFEKLRDDWELPDGRIVLPEGQRIRDGLGMYRHARELALGFYYIWDPAPPSYWMEARRDWYKFVRKVLRHSRTLDSEKQVRLAHPDQPELLEWSKVREEFYPKTVAVWLDDSLIDYCASWAEQAGGIVWTEHVQFAERLSKKSGLSYYGREGFDARGSFIEDHPAGKPLIASIQSNAEGRNLQTSWSGALITSCPANGKQMEQLLGRIHREGQEADEVSFDVVVTCAEHVGAFWQAVADCRDYVQQTMGTPQKLGIAGLNVMTADELARRRGARWDKEWRSSA